MQHSNKIEPFLFGSLAPTQHNSTLQKTAKQAITFNHPIGL